MCWHPCYAPLKTALSIVYIINVSVVVSRLRLHLEKVEEDKAYMLGGLIELASVLRINFFKKLSVKRLVEAFIVIL
jgi:hypothetical protein